MGTQTPPPDGFGWEQPAAPLPWVPAGAEEAGAPPDDWDPSRSAVWAEEEPAGLAPPRSGPRRGFRLVAALMVLGIAAGVAAASLGRAANQAPQALRRGSESGAAASPSISPASSARALEQVASQDLPEVVTVVAIGSQSEELGTGWPVDGNGDYITNEHVVHDGLTVHVLSSDGGQYLAQVINSDPSLDLAEVRVTGLSETPLPLDLGPVPIGEPVVVLASGRATGHPPVTYSTVVGLNQRATVPDAQPGELSNYGDLIGFPARIFPGNSGGPVLTTAGQVMGILTLAAEHGPGAFAIPLAEVYPVLEKWLQG